MFTLLVILFVVYVVCNISSQNAQLARIHAKVHERDVYAIDDEDGDDNDFETNYTV